MDKIIFETKNWKVILAEDQTYLGRSSAVLKRPARFLSELSEEEIIDFLNVVRTFEQKAKDGLGARMFNWGCLMNNAYQEKDPKPQVHFHVRPRYDRPVELLGEKFKDPNFGYHYQRNSRKLVSEEISEAIVERLK